MATKKKDDWREKPRSQWESDRVTRNRRKNETPKPERVQKTRKKATDKIYSKATKNATIQSQPKSNLAKVDSFMRGVADDTKKFWGPKMQSAAKKTNQILDSAVNRAFQTSNNTNQTGNAYGNSDMFTKQFQPRSANNNFNPQVSDLKPHGGTVKGIAKDTLDYWGQKGADAAKKTQALMDKFQINRVGTGNQDKTIRGVPTSFSGKSVKQIWKDFNAVPVSKDSKKGTGNQSYRSNNTPAQQLDQGTTPSQRQGGVNLKEGQIGRYITKGKNAKGETIDIPTFTDKGSELLGKDATVSGKSGYDITSKGGNFVMTGAKGSPSVNHAENLLRQAQDRLGRVQDQAIASGDSTTWGGKWSNAGPNASRIRNLKSQLGAVSQAAAEDPFSQEGVKARQIRSEIDTLLAGGQRKELEGIRQSGQTAREGMAQQQGMSEFAQDVSLENLKHKNKMERGQMEQMFKQANAKSKQKQARIMTLLGKYLEARGMNWAQYESLSADEKGDFITGFKGLYKGLFGGANKTRAANYEG